jgi:hypothetical protein
MVSLKNLIQLKIGQKNLHISGIVLLFERAVVIVGTRQAFPFL